jgi:DNA-directed RNA polymerase subunit RPC12/RpoP
MNFNRALALVSWNPRYREGDFIFYVRGTGETGWWHDHSTNPMEHNEHHAEYDREAKVYRCRECRAEHRPTLPPKGWYHGGTLARVAHYYVHRGTYVSTACRTHTVFHSFDMVLTPASPDDARCKRCSSRSSRREK